MSATRATQVPPALRRLAASRWTPWAVVVLAPLLGLLLLRAPLVNHLAYRDPWFYSGYGWALPHHLETFGWFYYGVRFPVVLPIRWSTELFGPLLGYVALRAVILAGTGAALYVCLRRVMSVPRALVGVVLLALSSFYLRSVLWDYTSFVALPAAIAAVAIWFPAAAAGRRGLPFVAAGALFGVAVFANALSVTIVGALLLVEGIAALRGRWSGIWTLAVRCLAATAGALGLFALGYLGCVAVIGWFSPGELIRPTLDFLTNNDQLAVGLQQKVSDWIDGEPRIWGPPLLIAALAIALGRRLLADTLEARLAQFAVAYVALLWLYRFVQTSSVIETWWAYNMVAVATCFAAPLILNAVADRHDARAILAAGVGGTAVISLLMRSFDDDAVDVIEQVRDRPVVIAAILAAGIALAVGLRVTRSHALAVGSTALLFALVAALHLVPARWVGIGQTGEFAQYGRYELDGYTAAYDLARLLERVEEPGERTLLLNVQGGLAMSTWIALPHQGSAILNPEGPDTVGQLPPDAIERITYPTTARVLVLSENQPDIAAASAAMERSGVRPALEQQGSWGSGKLHWGLFRIPQAGGEK